MKINPFNSMQGANALSNIGGSIKKSLAKLANNIKSFSFSSPGKAKSQMSSPPPRTSQPARTPDQQQKLFQNMGAKLSPQETSDLKVGHGFQSLAPVGKLLEEDYSLEDVNAFISHLREQQPEIETRATETTHTQTEDQIQATKGAIKEALSGILKNPPNTGKQIQLQGQNYMIARTNGGAVLQKQSDYDQGAKTGFFLSNDGTIVSDGGDEFKNLSYNEFVRNLYTD